MSVIRWILRNMLFVFAAAVVVIGYVYWDAVRPELVKLGVIIDDAPVLASSATPPAPSTPTTVPSHTSTSKPAAIKKPASVPTAAAVSSPAPAPAPESAMAPSATASKPAKALPTARYAPQPAAPRQMLPTTRYPHSSAPQQSKESKKPAPSLSADLHRDWAAARAAYWQRDLKKAINLYEALIARHPGQADVLGELGNIYFMMRDRQKATESYLAAGELLVASDRPMSANKALMPLRMLDPKKADVLRQKIFAASGKTTKK